MDKYSRHFSLCHVRIQCMSMYMKVSVSINYQIGTLIFTLVDWFITLYREIVGFF